jgi:hypothetical protein
MTQVIIYTNEIGGVSVCVPSSELDINAVKAKDCPASSIIVDYSSLPQGDDANYFDAWVLNNGVVTVDASKKAAIQAQAATINALTARIETLENR